MTPGTAQRTGIALLTGSGQAVDKLPVLRDVMKNLTLALPESLHPSAAARLELSLLSVDAGKAGDVLSAHAESVAGAAIQCERWDGRILAGIDRGFLQSLIDALFGGDGNEPPYLAERPLTKLETAIVKWLFQQLGSALRSAFERIVETTFAVEKVDCPPAFDCIGKPSAAIASASFTLKCNGGTGRMFVAFPQPALAFLKSAPVSEPAVTAPAADPAWTRLLGSRISRAGLSMTATLGSTQMTLGDIAGFRPGQIIGLDTVSQNRVRLDCNGQALYWCTLGQADGSYTLSIEREIDREQEFMDDILSH